MFHLVQRYVRSFRPGAGAQDRAWAVGYLNPGEQRLFDRMTTYDQRHAIETAEALVPMLVELGIDEPEPWIAAALLHDVGKYHAQLDPTRRAFATVLGSIVGRTRTRVWSQQSHGFLRRVGMYVEHGPIGADDIRNVGGREEPAQWSAAHHEPPMTWASLGFPEGVTEALDRADHA